MKIAVILLSIVLFISIAGNVILCLNPKETTIIKQEMPKEEIEKIREISSICGIDPETFEHSSVLSNLSDIKSALWNSIRICDVTPISQEEMEILDVYLNNRPDLSSRIKAQNAFVKPFSSKRFMILPVKE